MIAEIDELLSYRANRSRFIQTCIRDQLDGVDAIPTPSLAIKTLLDVIANNPNNINPRLLKELYDSIQLDFTFTED